MNKRQTKERITQAVEDAQTEIAGGRWRSVYPMLREAADQARALQTPPVRVHKLQNNGLQSDPKYSQSLERGLAILALFSEQPIWRLADIADKLGYSRSTTHRYMLTLASLGQLEQTTGRRYRRVEPEPTKAR